MKTYIRILLLSIIVVTMGGCAISPDSRKTAKEPFLETGNPVAIGRYYLDAIYTNRQKNFVYDLLSPATREMIAFEQFDSFLADIQTRIDMKDAYFEVVHLDLYAADVNNVAVYYLLTYEQQQTGVYYVVELFLKKYGQTWKIELTEGQGDRMALIPVIQSGEVARLNRRQLQDIQSAIDAKIAQYRQQAAPYSPSEIVPEQPASIEEQVRIIKKELVVGKVYYDVGDYEKARHSFEKILSLDPEHVEAREYLQKTVYAIERKERELREEQNRRDEEQRRLEAEQRRKEEDRRREEEQHRLEKQPQRPVVPEQPIAAPDVVPIEDQLFFDVFKEAQQLYNQGDYRKAIIQFQKAHSLKPDNVEVLSYIDKCERAIQVLSH